MSKDTVTKLHGYSDDPSVAKEVMVELYSGGEWVYVEVVDRCLQVWSGKACETCQLTQSGLERCRLHAKVKMVALQLRLTEHDRAHST